MKCPYWLIHEPGKKSGVGTVQFADSIEDAIRQWRADTDPKMIELFDLYQTELTARVVSTPFFPAN